MNLNVLKAIFFRNFYAYFSSPTGYVFICVFVLLSSLAAFWPNEFFNDNLANLDQLNKYFPFIMLVFIPAITMSIWSEERRQGTDELLLTIPAGDFDVVLRKYLAAVAIYTTSLLFSLICNFTVLEFLGQPDGGLILGTYLGYWFVGLAMLAIGMVASFLTGNLTVGFTLGALFNAPLAFAASADVIMPRDWADWVDRWSVSTQFRDFGQGVISLASMAYFLSIVAVCLYLSMILIGRRHWAGGREGSRLGWHFLARAVAMSLIAVGVVATLDRHDVRADITTEQLSSLAPDTVRLIREVESERPIKIEAYVSPEVPESYVQTRLNLINVLREISALGGNKLVVNVYDTEPLSNEADRAETQYDIVGREVVSRERGALSQESIYLGVAVTSGLDKVVIPFVDRGIPVEYELVRSICTVAQDERKRLGVLTTDAKLFGGFDQNTFSQSPDQPIIDELKKQYDVVEIDPTNAIPDNLDVLLAVQPSSLGPEQMNNFIAAVKRGTPTAIFEDPLPVFDSTVPGTIAPKQAAQSNPFMGSPPPEPKGNIAPLWKLLGVEYGKGDVIWQDYCPYPKFKDMFPPEFVWVDTGEGGEAFNPKEKITSKLQQMLFPFAGGLERAAASKLKFEPLVLTGRETGALKFDDMLQRDFFGRVNGLNPSRIVKRTGEEYVLAAHITGRPPADTATKTVDEQAAASQEPELNVVLVSDIDVLYPEFFSIRAQGTDPDSEFNMLLDNVPFCLNVLDVLAEDDRFLEVRKRRPVHRTLTEVEEVTLSAREQALEQIETFRTKFDTQRAMAEKDFNDAIAKIESQGGDPTEKLQRVGFVREVGQKRLQAATDELQRTRDKEVGRVERELELEIRSVQDHYKLWAVLLPPIPPLLVGAAVFFNRRAREREGVARSRLK